MPFSRAYHCASELCYVCIDGLKLLNELEPKSVVCSAKLPGRAQTKVQLAAAERRSHTRGRKCPTQTNRLAADATIAQPDCVERIAARCHAVRTRSGGALEACGARGARNQPDGEEREVGEERGCGRGDRI